MKLKHLLLLLMTVVSFSATRAADEWKDVKFNPDVRYSKLVLDSRLGDFYGNTNTMGFATYNQDLSEKKGFPTWSSSKGILIDYVAGLVAKAAVEATILYQDYDWSKPWFKSVESYANHERVSVPTGGGSLDDLNAAKMYFGLYTLATTNDDFAKIAASTTVSNAKTQLEHAMSGLTAHNGGNAFASGTKLGNNDISDGWFHKSIYENQMWLDGQYMGPALLAELINDKKTYTAITADDWGLVAKQFTIVWNQCWDDKEKLLYHAFTSVANKTWAEDGEVWTTRKTDTSNWTGMTAGGHSAAFWGRAEGWYLLALVDVLEQMPTSNSNYTTLKGYLNTLAAGIAARQDATTGCWYQLVGKPGNYTAQYYNGDGPTTVTNYLESSCTAIFAAAYLKGARLGLFVDNGTDNNAKYKEIGEKAYAGLVNQFMKQRTDGTVDLFGCCRSAGLGTDALKAEKFRDGSNAYYLHGYDIIPTPQPYKGKDGHYTEGKVLGAFILAATEYERINHKEHPVLLTLDTPKECTLDGKTALEVAVNGNGNEIYQWYEKTTGAIPGAQSATYTPTNDGTYYCAITVPAPSSSAKGRIAARAAEYTLTSSETNVTVTAETEDNTNTGTGGPKFSLSDVKQNLKVSPSTTEEITSAYATIVGGQAFLYNGKNASGGESNVAEMLRISDGVVLNSSNGSYLHVTLTSVLSAGDIIAIGAEGKLYVASNATKPGTDTTFPYTVKEGDNLCGNNELWFWQSTLSKFKSLTITTPSISITTQPQSSSYTVGATTTVSPLTIEASVVNGTGYTLTYQWYKNTINTNTGGTAIATGASYTPTLRETVGTDYYYCVVTATKGSATTLTVTSDVAAVAVLKESNLAYTKACGDNNGTWTPAAGGTIALSELVTSSSTGVYTITSGNEFATLSADGTTLTAVKNGTITLSQAADDTYASGSVDINIAIGSNVAKDGTNAYTVEKNQVYSDGLTVTREDITMTFGNDGFWRQVTDENLWTQGQTNPNPADGKIPTSGTYYKFTPAKNGTLKATVYIGTKPITNADGSTTQQLRPLYVSENGTAIEATAGDLTFGKGETPVAPAVGYYQGEVTFNVKANTDYYVYVNGSKMRFYGFTFVPVLSSDNTATFSRGVLNGETLTVTHHKSEANSDQTITVTPAIGATCTSVSGPATLDGDVIRYTAPVAGASLADITLTVTAENGDAKTYNIKVSTVGDVTIGNAIFSLDELRGFGTRSDKGEVTVLTKENVTLTATENGVIEGGQTGTNGTKVKSGAGFTITPNNGVRITKITIVTDNTGRWFTATPTQEGEMKRTDKTYEYSFNSIDQAVTFMNNSGNNLYANRIIVEYEKSVEGGKTILSASFDKEELVFYMNDDIPSPPVLSVTAGGQSVASNLYDVKYTSFNTYVVTIDETGVLALPEGNIAGSAVINVEIHPKNSDTYVGSEAFYTVTVKPLDIPTVYVHDITVYNTAGMQPEPVVDVYVKDEAGRSISLPKDSYTLAYTQQSGDAILISDKTGKFILAGEAGNWTMGSAVVRVEFNPTDDARQHYHITDTYVDFNVHVVTAGARLIPEIGGVSEARMQISDNKSERSFVTPVLYDGVDISTGFTFKYTLRDANNTGSKFQNAASDGSVTSKGDGYVTLLSGMTAGTVYIDITATPDENYKSQYNEVTKAIRVTVADLKRYNSVTITPSSITAKVGDVLQGFDIVVRDEHDNIVSEDDYTMFWGSSAPGVVAIAGNRGVGVFNAVAAGKAIVRVFVTDKAGEYSDRKGECTVTVIDDGTFKVTPEKIAELTGDKYDSSKENYGITASKLKGLELSVLDGLSVVLGGWMFPNSVKGSHGTTTETLGGAQWGAPTSKYRKPLGFTHNIHMGDQKNARQEYGSNCQPESNCIYDKTLTEVNDGFRLMDPMFNVPCSGSYLAFYPKTTGTVTVYIRQNGVFDNQTKNEVTTCVYRPQRRVFVIDEMGNFVSSTPNLEYPTTWNDNGLDTDGTKYTCDILGNSSEETKIYDLAKNDVTITGSTDKEKVQNWVKKHFEGLKTFDIAPDKFQNGVYASNLDNDITHNNAQLNHSGDPAAKGWCVLTAAPVSYKFNVKAGKTYYLYNYGSKLELFGFTFRPTDFVVDEKTWSQTSETNSPEKTPDNHVAKVSIPDRTFPAGIWSACVLPFSMNRIQVNNVFGDCYDKNNLEGTQILYFDRVENGVIYFRRHAYNTIVAGKPFLIKPTKEAVISSENMGTKFPYVTIEAVTPQAEWGRTGSNVDENYKWVSSYNKLAVVKGAHYINSDGGLSLYTRDDNAKMNGFRGYLKPKTAQAASKVLKLAYDSNIDGDGEATPIEGLVMDREGNLLEVPTSGVVYNLSGQVVTRDADKLYTLPAGIYIVNGKKYIVR